MAVLAKLHRPNAHRGRKIGMILRKQSPPKRQSIKPCNPCFLYVSLPQKSISQSGEGDSHAHVLRSQIVFPKRQGAAMHGLGIRVLTNEMVGLTDSIAEVCLHLRLVGKFQIKTLCSSVQNLSQDSYIPTSSNVRRDPFKNALEKLRDLPAL